jgi:hypothetical protein
VKALAAVLTAALLSLSYPGSAQVPPPPPLPGQDDLGRNLVADFDRKDPAGYAALLSNSVQVYDDGVLVARSKDEWMRRFGPELAAKGVTFRLSPGYSSTGRLLFIEYFNSMASWGDGPPRDCCWGYSAVAYDISGGKIVKIQRLNGGTARLDDKGSSASN